MSALTAPITASASGDNVVVAGMPNYAIRVLGYVISFAGAVNARWMSDVLGGAVALTGQLTGVAAGTNITASVVGANARGWFQTAPGKALNLNLSGAVQVNGHVLWELVSQ